MKERSLFAEIAEGFDALAKDRASAQPSAVSPTNPGTSLVSERLTNSEIESLRQDKKDSLAYAQKAYFPKAKVRRVT